MPELTEQQKVWLKEARLKLCSVQDSCMFTNRELHEDINELVAEIERLLGV